MTVRTSTESLVCADCGHSSGYSPYSQCACSYDRCPGCLNDEASAAKARCAEGDHEIFFDVCTFCGITKWQAIDEEQRKAREADEAECLAFYGEHCWDEPWDDVPGHPVFCINCDAQKEVN